MKTIEQKRRTDAARQARRRARLRQERELDAALGLPPQSDRRAELDRRYPLPAGVSESLARQWAESNTEQYATQAEALAAFEEWMERQ